MTSTVQPAHLRRVVPIFLLFLFLLAEALRVGAALWLVRRNQAAGVEHEFADSELYWMLALRLEEGEPYNDGKRQALRTPGYPVFLAGSIRLFGPSTTAARHAQAAVGAASCILLFFLVKRPLGPREAWLAASLAAVYPFAVFLSVVLLSEAVFTFVLLVQLLVLARLILPESNLSPGRELIWAGLAGLVGAAATLVRPSWILAMPALALVLPYRGGEHSVVRRLAPSVAVLLGFVLGMSPWWIRNAQVTGHFVPTTLWVGASLYDGWNKRATGASNMEFMDHPAEFGLDDRLPQMSEWEQDRYLEDAAWQFARSQPLRVLSLAWAKFVRFWNPLPNAAEWRSGWLRLISLFTCGPALVLAALGAWRLRRRWRVLLLLAGPLLYFAAIHLIFVSSIRYREAAMLPVLGLVAAGLFSLISMTRSLGWVVRR